VSDSDLADAVRAMHDAHAAAIHAWARRQVADPSDVDEVVQETLVRAWRGRDTYDASRGSERAWLFGIARHVVVDRHRAAQRHLRVVAPAPVDDDSIDRAVETSHVRDALGSLSEDHRAVIVATFYRGGSVREVAQSLGIPEGTVKSRLHYGLKALRNELERREVLP
jgi:RNA polymerase sigma-70 factor, ECF subfamily